MDLNNFITKHMDNTLSPLYRERKLWQAVIIQGFYEIVSSTSTKHVKKEYIDWFSEPNSGFSEVCMLAHLNENKVRAAFLSLINKQKLNLIADKRNNKKRINHLSQIYM